tara:strand:+ start:9658 stop:10641 length:984 start_codon:yes stop_codon:yes gene_type:complete
MLVQEIILEKEDKTVALGQQIISILKKTPTAQRSGSKGQFKNDPGGLHRSARAKFREWCISQGMAYINPNIMNRGGTPIRFYTFVGMMQKECGLPTSGVLDVSTMKGFMENSSKFNDNYINSRVESSIASSGVSAPRGCIDVVKAIENPINAWTSAYASYHDVNGNLDSGIGPGQVEPKTYGDVKGGTFNFADWDDVTSIEKLTKLMLETILLKMKFGDRIAKKDGRETATLEDFGKAWNYKHYGKAKSLYGDGVPMRDKLVTKPPLKRPAELEPSKKEPTVDKTAIDKAVKKAIEPKAEPEDKPGYFGRLKKGLGNMMRNYLDSDK